jgi:hypothetical protein
MQTLDPDENDFHGIPGTTQNIAFLDIGGEALDAVLG